MHISVSVMVCVLNLVLSFCDCRAWDLMNFRAAFRLRLPKGIILIFAISHWGPNSYNSMLPLHICAAADLVVWSPIGDQYALSVQKDISIYDVSVREQILNC